jgi:hypothetical protein
MAKKQYCKKDFMEPENTLACAKQVKPIFMSQPGTSHRKITFPKGAELPNGKKLDKELHLEVPMHTTGLGLACKIFKFFAGIGLVCLGLTVIISNHPDLPEKIGNYLLSVLAN